MLPLYEKTPVPNNPRVWQRKGKAINYLCRLVGISRQKYYRDSWRSDKRQVQSNKTLALVDSIRYSMPRIGTHKLYYLLKDALRSIVVGRDKLFTILRANQQLIKSKRNYRITTNSHHRFRKHKNLIANMDIVCPKQVWVAVIIYIGGRSNAYLSLITGAYSKRIMGTTYQIA